jgi:hypothetical protein
MSIVVAVKRTSGSEPFTRRVADGWTRNERIVKTATKPAPLPCSVFAKAKLDDLVMQSMVPLSVSSSHGFVISTSSTVLELESARFDGLKLIEERPESGAPSMAWFEGTGETPPSSPNASSRRSASPPTVQPTRPTRPNAPASARPRPFIERFIFLSRLRD